MAHGVDSAAPPLGRVGVALKCLPVKNSPRKEIFINGNTILVSFFKIFPAP